MNDAIVETVPTSKLPVAVKINAVLGTEKNKLAGYISGIAEHLCIQIVSLEIVVSKCN